MIFRRLRKRTKRAAIDFLATMHDAPLSAPSQREQKLVKELRAIFATMERIGGQAEGEWLDNVARLQELVTAADPREFLRWDVIHKTMFVGQAAYVWPELQWLRRRSDWASRWVQVIQESRAGHPMPYWRYPAASGNRIHHTYHWAKYEEATGSSARDMDLIFEFGGGYGSMCLLAHRLGFRGRYVLYDLPAYSALQKFYLQMADMNVISPDSLGQTPVGILCISEPAILESVLSDSLCADSLFVATWSLSESPVELRERMLNLTRPFTRFLVGYQAKFAGVDNASFFRRWQEARNDVEWKDVEAAYLPANSRYLMGSGRRKDGAHPDPVTPKR